MTLEEFKKAFPDYFCTEIVDGRPYGTRMTKKGKMLGGVYIGFLGGFFVLHPTNEEALTKQTPTLSVDSFKAKLDNIAEAEFGGWETSIFIIFKLMLLISPLAIFYILSMKI